MRHAKIGNRRNGHLRRTGPQELEFSGLQQQPGRSKAYMKEQGVEAAPRSVQGESLCPVRLDPVPCDRRAALKPGYANRRVNITLLYGKACISDRAMAPRRASATASLDGCKAFFFGRSA